MLRKVMNSHLYKTMKDLDISYYGLTQLKDEPIPYNLFGKEAKHYSHDNVIFSLYLSDGRLGFHVHNDFVLAICFSVMEANKSFRFGDKKNSSEGSCVCIQNRVNLYSKRSNGDWCIESSICPSLVVFETSNFKTDNKTKANTAMEKWIKDRKVAASDCLKWMARMIPHFPKDWREVPDFAEKFM